MAKIKITRTPYEEPHHINLLFEASNESQSTTLDYYCNATDLSDIADHLEVFPRHNTDVFLYEFGSERMEDRHAYYFRLRVFLTNGVGACAIQIRTNNNQEMPDREISEFCISAEPSQINRLGQLFRSYSKLNHTVLEWQVENGHLS